MREFRIGLHIGNMNGACLRARLARRDRSSSGLQAACAACISTHARAACRSSRRRWIGSLRRAATDCRLIRFAQPRRRFDQRIEHRLQIEGRAADDLEHVGGGGLLLQRFAQLVEQARVLDGDDGLGGEVL